MRFGQVSVDLLRSFQSIPNIIKEIEDKNYHQHSIVVEKLSNGSEISIHFVGYKSKVVDGKVVYDYRVDLNKSGLITSLSHANIICDIYNKVKYGGLNHKSFQQAIIESAKEGDFNFSDLESTYPYEQCRPNQEVIELFSSIHRKLKKGFNSIGNTNDLTFEELFKSILYISVQEDLNYPIESGFEGRRMCFARYIETLYLFEETERTLFDVLARTLSHKRQSKWKELNYSFLKKIN